MIFLFYYIFVNLFFHSFLFEFIFEHIYTRRVDKFEFYFHLLHSKLEIYFFA